MKNIKKRFLFLSTVIFIILMTSMAYSIHSIKEDFVSDEVIVKLKENKKIDSLNLGNIKSYEKIIKSDNKYLKAKGLDRLHLLKVKNVRKALKDLRKHASVEYAEPNYIVEAILTPNDPDFSNLYGLHNTGQTGGKADADIDAPEAWGLQTGSSNVIVAVIDTGVDYTHEDLADNMWINPGEAPNNGLDDDDNGLVDDYFGWDFYNNSSDPFDDHGHGTHCAGTIGAAGNNSIGVVGVNWNVKIMPLKFLSSGGSGTTADAISAIEYATLMGADIMSNSWGGGGFSQALKDIIEAANTAGILFVAAAGNNGANNDQYPHYPSSYDVPNVIAVAATDHNDDLAGFSCYGALSVDLGAPGVNIFSTVPNGSCSLCDASGYKSLSGTSMATPHVAGVAGLIKAQFPELTSDGIKTRLLGGVDLIPSLDEIIVTGGRLNAYNSLEVDNIPPSAVTDLNPSEPAFNSVTLTWTAAGDDGTAGTASFYDVRYSTSTITNDNWDTATKAAGEPQPQPCGSEEIFTVMGLSHTTTYYFAMKIFDNVGNPSGLSNVVSETTITPIIVFEDDMEEGIGDWIHSGAGDNWELGMPTSGPGSAYSGYNVWATNLNGNYGADNMNAQLVSPSFDLNGIKSSQLTFQHHYSTESYYDGGIVEISTNGGSSWTQITPVGGYSEDALYSGNPLGSVPAYSGYSGEGWHQAVFDISGYDGSSNMNIRFRFGTDLSVNSYPGWYIDDVAVLGELGEPNNPPVADANGPYTGTEDIAVTFDGSDSFDLDGDTLTYNWDFGDGSTGTGANPSHTYTAGENYTVTLIVNDGKLDSEASTTTAAIAEVNDAPVANAGEDQFVNDIDGDGFEIAALNGNGSFDIDGVIVNYEWFEDANLIASGVNPTVNFSVGIHNITLKVTDEGEASGSDNVVITINQAPVADANGPYTGTEDIAVTFDGSNSFDPDGDTLTYNWDFGDGSTGTGANPSHTYTAAGDYIVALIVNDGKLDSEASTTTAAIAEVNDAPVANAGPDQTVTDSDGDGFESITLDGSDSYDIDGTIESYEWKEGSIVLGTGAVITTNFAVGVHIVTLTAVDNGGLSASDDVTITIYEAATDTVTITKAKYKNGQLTVEAVSDDPNAILTVVDYGEMTKKRDRWVFRQRNVLDPGETITVASSSGGSDTANVE